MLFLERGSTGHGWNHRRMKRKSAAPESDWTGLICTAAMGLLVLLAWATLPALPLHLPIPAGLPPPVSALAGDLLESASPTP